MSLNNNVTIIHK